MVRTPESAEISVACERDGAGWVCDVTVTEAGTETRHQVRISAEELARYGGSEAGVDRLVERSFRFLLAREPKEAILGRFALSDIERYFPEFRNEFGH